MMSLWNYYLMGLFKEFRVIQDIKNNWNNDSLYGWCFYNDINIGGKKLYGKDDVFYKENFNIYINEIKTPKY